MSEVAIKSNEEQEQRFNFYRSALVNLKKKPPAKKVPHTAREIVNALHDDVVALFADGYSIMDICDALAGATNGISSATFKNHVQRIKSSIGNLPKPKRKRSGKKQDIPCDSDDNTDSIAGDSDNEAEVTQKVAEKPAKQPAVGVETPTLSVADGGIEVYPDEI